MEEENNLFWAQAIPVLLVLYLLIFMFGELFTGYNFIFILGSICGLSFSWLFRENAVLGKRQIIDLAALGVVAWLIYSLFASSLIYKEIILIFLKGVILLELIFSFNLNEKQYLRHMQILTIPLFMCLPLVVKDNLLIVISVIGYFAFWAISLKAELHQFLKSPLNKTNFPIKYLLLLLSLALAGSVISLAFFLKCPLGKLGQEGIFLAESQESEESTLEKKYYGLQGDLIKAVSDFISEIKYAQDRHAALALLDYLIQDAATIKEVDKAELGLISYLKTPGPGLEKGNGPETEIILKNYIEKKIAMNLKNIKEDMLNTLKKNPLKIRERLEAASLINKIINDKKPNEVIGHGNELLEAINASSLDNQQKNDLEESLKQLLAWKEYSFLRQQPVLLKEGTETTTPEEQAREFEAKKEIANEKIKEEGVPAPQKKKRIGESFLTTQFFLNIDKLSQFFPLGFVFLILGIFVLISRLVFLTGRKKYALMNLYRHNPKGFIIELYANLKEILPIFGFEVKNFILPLAYAEMAQDKFPVSENILIKLTAKFEEAKYSSHVLGVSDASQVLENYNKFLKILFKNQGKVPFFLKYCLAFIYSIPFSL